MLEMKQYHKFNSLKKKKKNKGMTKEIPRKC